MTPLQTPMLLQHGDEVRIGLDDQMLLRPGQLPVYKGGDDTEGRRRIRASADPDSSTYATLRVRSARSDL